MKRLSYELVIFEMAKLWNKKIDIDDVNEIDKHCVILQVFVESCGWDIESFTRRMLDSKFIN